MTRRSLLQLPPLLTNLFISHPLFSLSPSNLYMESNLRTDMVSHILHWTVQPKIRNQYTKIYIPSAGNTRNHRREEQRDKWTSLLTWSIYTTGDYKLEHGRHTSSHFDLKCYKYLMKPRPCCWSLPTRNTPNFLPACIQPHQNHGQGNPSPLHQPSSRRQHLFRAIRWWHHRGSLLRPVQSSRPYTWTHPGPHDRQHICLGMAKLLKQVILR